MRNTASGERGGCSRPRKFARAAADFPIAERPPKSRSAGCMNGERSAEFRLPRAPTFEGGVSRVTRAASPGIDFIFRPRCFIYQVNFEPK